jgi:hypothetical protein
VSLAEIAELKHPPAQYQGLLTVQHSSECPGFDHEGQLVVQSKPRKTERIRSVLTGQAWAHQDEIVFLTQLQPVEDLSLGSKGRLQHHFTPKVAYLYFTYRSRLVDEGIAGFLSFIL